MKTQNSLSSDELKRLEAICVRFENAESEDDRNIEHLVKDVQTPARIQFIYELVALDLELREQRGESPLESDYSSFTNKTDVAAAKKAFHEFNETREFDGRLGDSRPTLPQRYKQLEEVGRGGLGSVWRVHDTKSQRTLAVKMLRDKFRNNRHANIRLEREALLTGSLQHPSVPPVHDFGHLSDGSVFFTMKLIDGQTLEQILKGRQESAADLSSCLGIFEQVAQAMAYVHAHGVIHRDLKPQNIMVGEFGEVQVMDWGMAKRITDDSVETIAHVSGQHKTAKHPVSDETVSPSSDSSFKVNSMLTRAGDVLGTPGYMPPEQARGEIDRLDARADVFSLGAILFETLTRKRLFENESPAAILGLAAAGDLSQSLTGLEHCEVDPALVDLCRKCLASNMEDRLADAGVVADEVSKYFAKTAERLKAADLERHAADVRANEETKRRKTITRMASLVLAVFAIGLAGVLWKWTEADAAGKLARENAIEFKKAESLAIARLKESREIVNEYFTEIADAKGLLSDSPGGQELRRTLLTKARDYYVKFVAESEGDDEVRFEAALASIKLGWIIQELNPASDEVFKSFEHGIKMLETVIAKNKPDFILDHQIELAKAYSELGLARRSAAQYQESLASHQSALTKLKFIFDRTGWDEHQLQVARQLNNIAIVQGQLGRNKEKKATISEAIELVTGLLKSHEKDPEYLFPAAKFHMTAGVLEGWQLGNWPLAREFHQTTILMLNRTKESNPDWRKVERQLSESMAQNNLAMIFYHCKQIDEAQGSFEQMLKIREKLAAENPAIPKYKLHVANGYGNYGTFLFKNGQPKLAAKAYQTASQISKKLALIHPHVALYNKAAYEQLANFSAINGLSNQSTAAFADTSQFLRQQMICNPENKTHPIELAVTLGALSREPSRELLELTQFVTTINKMKSRQLCARSLANLRNENYQDALDCLEKQTDEEEALFTELLRSLILAKLQQFDRAEESLATATKMLDAIEQTTNPPEYPLLLLQDEARQMLNPHPGDRENSITVDRSAQKSK